MIRLIDKSTGKLLGRITEEDLQFLVDNLEEEDLSDTDYYVNRATLDMLKEKGMDDDLAALLEGAMGEGDEIEIGYEKG
jgi:hypothetical protein